MLKLRCLPVLLLLPLLLSAQEIPLHLPVSPIVVARSPLYSQPLISPQQGWHFSSLLDYSSAVEVAGIDNRVLVLDAELLTVNLRVRRDFSTRRFAFIDLPMRGAYDGFLDGFLDEYHRITGLKVPARNRLPRNQFAWQIDFPDTTVIYQKPNIFLGDIRLGTGWRWGTSQLVASVVLPTASTKAEGWRRHRLGLALSWTQQLYRSDRLSWEGGLSAGWTQAAGATPQWQRENFLGGMTAARWRFWKQQALYASLWVQPGIWRDTGLRTLDNADVTLDFGGLIRPGKGWPELQLGVTEDLYPDGPAQDIGFRVGIRW